jgi:hypothetical protein
MSIHEQLLEKWQQCREKRYPVLFIITAPLDILFPPDLVKRFADASGAKVIDFKNRYQNRLDEFFTWQTVRNKIYDETKKTPVIVTELEPFYAKWPLEERLSFVKNLIRSETAHGIVIIINCQEDLSELNKIEENSRGLIWAPSK